MPRFSYTATKDGKTIQGSAEAINREAVIALLAKENARALVIKQEAGKKDLAILNRLLGTNKVKLKDMVIFSRQLSTMISAGVPLPRCLATLEAQTTNKYFKTVIQSISKDVEGGISMADAFAKYPHVFSDIFVNMVRAGEEGGILDEILKRVAAQLEQDSSMRKKIKSASAYPTAIFVITVIAFFGIMLFAMPKIGKILLDLGGEDAKLPPLTLAMLAISNAMKSQAVLIIGGSIGTVVGIKWYISTPKGKYNFHRFLLRVPVLKDLIRKIAVARFARTFASLMSSGVTVLDALESTGGAIGNKVIEAELRAAAIEVKNGKQLSEPLSRSKNFPAIVSQMLAIGEETGQIDTILVKVADFYDEEVTTVIDSLSSLIEPIMIVILGGVVGLIAASVMGPIASLSKNIGT